jgi:hypothetical protein
VIVPNDPELPAMETVAVLAETAAEELAERVITWVPGAGPAANEAVTPLGSPIAVSATEPEKPPWFATVIVLAELLPWTTFKVAGEAESTNPAGGAVPPSIANWTLDGP